MASDGLRFVTPTRRLRYNRGANVRARLLGRLVRPIAKVAGDLLNTGKRGP